MAGGDVWILDWIDVDRPAEGVTGPDPGPARHFTTVESRSVVGRHRPVVIGSVGIDQPHPADPESVSENPPEDPDKTGCRGFVNDQIAAAHHAPKVVVAELEQSQVSEPDGAAPVPGGTGHAMSQSAIKRQDRGPVPVRKPILPRGRGRAGSDDQGRQQADNCQSGPHPTSLISPADRPPVISGGR